MLPTIVDSGLAFHTTPPSNVTLPGTINAGDSIYIICLVAGSSVDPSACSASGYSLYSTSGTSSSYYSRIDILHKTADGTEGGTSVSVTFNYIMVSRVIVVPGNTLVDAAYVIGGKTPPAITPPWGAKESKFTVGFYSPGSGYNVSAAPSGYSNYQEIETSLDAATGDKTDTVTTETPGSFTATVNAYRLYTLALYIPNTAGNLFFGSNF